MPSTRRTKAVVVGALLALLAASCGEGGGGEGGEGRSEILIGLVTDLSGPFTTFGTDIVAATELAVEEVNADGGINGSPIRVEVEDTAGAPDQAVTAIRGLAQDGAFAISGPLSSGESEIAFAQSAALQIPTITGTANKEGITDIGKGWAFRNTATNTYIFNKAIPIWQEQYDIQSAVLAFDEEEPVAAAAATTAIPAAAQENGLEIVNADDPITFIRGQTDFATVVQRIRDTDADGIIIQSGPESAGLIARELDRQGEDRSVLGHNAQATSAFFERGGALIDDWVVPLPLNRAQPSEEAQAWLEEVEKRDPEPPTVAEAANYYENIHILAQVMREADLTGDTPPDEAREAIREGLLALEGFDGITGTVSFSGSVEAEKEIWIHVIRNGELELLES